MTLLDDTSTLFKNVLSLVAHHPTLDEAVPVLLRDAIAFTQAVSGFYLLFDSPRRLICEGVAENALPDDETLFGWVAQSTTGYYGEDMPNVLQGAYSAWLYTPLRAKNRLVGALVLLFSTPEQITPTHWLHLSAIVNGLDVVTNNAQVKALHDKLMRNQNEFVRIVSHDLRSPLTSIRGFASMLESHMVGELNEKQAHYVGKILSGVSQMTALVDNIQDAGRYDPETGFYEIERKPVDVVEIVRNIVNNHLLPAEKSELTISVATTDDVPIINADATMLERGIINLVDNAIKYTPNGGKIEVKVQRIENQLLITVKDNGLGISKENLRQLFQRHFRIRRPEHKLVKGSGLGLFIVRSVALRHGGDAFVESAEGEGSTFGMMIPLEGANLLGGGD